MLARAFVIVASLVAGSLPGAARAETTERTLTLIHLNDLHANLVPHTDLERTVSTPAGSAEARVVERGGIARIATLVRRIRTENPHSVLMNVGDTYHGGVEAMYTRGNAIAPAVNALGIDVGVPGNWDFAFGIVVTRLRYEPEPSWLPRLVNWLVWGEPVERASFPNLAANLTRTFPPFAAGDPLLPGTLVLEVGGVRVGFIGLTSDIVPRMAAPFAWGFDFLQGEQPYRDLIDDAAAQLRAAGAEVVVVMSELGIHKDRRLAEIVKPGVHVFFSAHTHELTREPLESASGALVVESGNDGWLGRMDLTLRDGAVVEHGWRLIPVDASVPDDPEVRDLVERARAPFLAPDVEMALPMPWLELPLTRPIDSVVGRSDVLLHRRNALENPFNGMLAEVIRRASGTQVAMTPGFRFDAVVVPEGGRVDGRGPASGELTLEQLYRFLPVAPSLATGEIRGEDLRKLIERDLTRVFSPDAFEQSGGWFGGFAGLEIEVDLARPDGERIRSLHLEGAREPIGDAEWVTVTSCVRPFDADDVMCSSPGFRDVAPFDNAAADRAWTPLELLTHAFETGEAPITAGSHVRDHSSLEQWPHDPFVQPLRQVEAP